MSVTIKDIAKDTGLSLATISKYLNQKNISEENRAIIESSIRKLHYIPNKTAQALRSKTSHCICLFMPDTWDYHFGYECNYIVEFLKEKGYSTLVRSYSLTSGDFTNDIVFLENRQVDGVVLFTHSIHPPALLSLLHTRGIPFVCMHQKPDIPADFVGCTDELAGQSAAEYLHRHGYSHVFLMGLNSYSVRYRTKGFFDFYQQYTDCRDSLSTHFYDSENALSADFIDSLYRSDAFLGVLISLDHTTTMQLLNYLPAQYWDTHSFLAFGDDDIFSAVTPALTVFSQDTRELGKQAAELLLKRMNGLTDNFPQTCLVPPVLIERESVVMNTPL